MERPTEKTGGGYRTGCGCELRGECVVGVRSLRIAILGGDGICGVASLPEGGRRGDVETHVKNGAPLLKRRKEALGSPALTVKDGPGGTTWGNVRGLNLWGQSDRFTGDRNAEGKMWSSATQLGIPNTPVCKANASKNTYQYIDSTCTKHTPDDGTRAGCWTFEVSRTQISWQVSMI
jgi:hypothetical protein